MRKCRLLRASAVVEGVTARVLLLNANQVEQLLPFIQSPSYSTISSDWATVRSDSPQRPEH